MSDDKNSTKTNHDQNSSDKEKKFYIVGIGASAGGLEAFEIFFKNMPSKNGMAFILVSHLEPDHVSLLPQILQKYTKMKVIQAEDGIRIQPDHVYVIPPNRDIGMLNRTIRLMEPSKPRGSRMPINFFLRTLADDQEEYAVCIILSGTGSDGSIGLKAIKEKAGLVMVQDKSSAKYDGMPQNAIATGLADYVIKVEKMPEELLKYTKHAIRKAIPPIPFSKEKENLPDVLQKIFIILRTMTNHDFSSYKQNTICRRIQKRMILHQLEYISDYLRYLQENKKEVILLFKELLIGVTNFFRDMEAFNNLKTQALYPLLKEKRLNDPVRIWVSGCSTGEEAYSLGILLQEYMDEHKEIFNVQIFATDIDEDAIYKARMGIYSTSIAGDISESQLQTYFIKENGGYRIRKHIRDMMVFAVHNLIKDPPFTKMDMICCRNVLIYMNSELQQKLFPIFHYALLPKGLLFLGSSESISNATDLFSPINVKWKIYQRKRMAHSTHQILDFPDSYINSVLSQPDNCEPIEKKKKLFSNG